LRKVGIQVKQGVHFIEQPALHIPDVIVGPLQKGPEFVRRLVEERIYGAHVSDPGYVQLQKYCTFVKAYGDGKGVEETARLLDVHRSTIRSWRMGVDIPYLAKLAIQASEVPRRGWLWLPTQLVAGGNAMSNWIQVPMKISNFTDIVGAVGLVKPLDSTYSHAQAFGLDRPRVDSMRVELFAYLLGFMLGDASKLGGEQDRFDSVNLDLQLSLRKESNLRLGEFVSLCANSLGISIHRIADKKPTGDSKFAQEPVGAFRWSSERSPLLAWMVSICLGLKGGEITSLHPIHMEWIFDCPRSFRLRFVQAVSDSDATVKEYEVVITSVPNADFVTRLLQSLGMPSARTIHENGKPLRTMVNCREAKTLPIFNELVNGYRYERLNRPFVR
jgi:hypothetical protein